MSSITYVNKYLHMLSTYLHTGSQKWLTYCLNCTLQLRFTSSTNWPHSIPSGYYPTRRVDFSFLCKVDFTVTATLNIFYE